MPNMQKRIRNEILEANQDNLAETKVAIPDPDNLYKLVGSIKGPVDTPYAGGTLLLDIQLHEAHPFGAPEIKFITKVFHPNVSSQTGVICLDVLKENWSPAMTLRLSLLSIQSLLDSPDVSSPQDFEVAKVYSADRSKFNKIASSWIDKYANISLEEYLSKNAKK